MSASSPGMVALNLATFRNPTVIDDFRIANGFLDNGERRALEEVASEVRGSPILDLGVGTGRTTSLLRLLSDEYVGVDYSPEMVSVCQVLHPGADIRVGDACQLTDLPSDHFGLVLFSNNGIDAVDRVGRRSALVACQRVLRPGGLLVISTLNVDGVSFGEVPWQIHRPHQPVRVDVKKVAYALLTTALHPLRRIMSYVNWARRRTVTAGDGWRYGALRAHDFGLVVHFTTLRRVCEDLAQAGFSVESTYGSDGRPVVSDAAVSRTDYFQIVARRLSS